MQRRIQILAVAVGMTALGLAVIRDHPWAAYVTFGCALIVAILALAQKDDIDTAAGLRRRILTLAKVVRTSQPKEVEGLLDDIDGVREIAAKRFGVYTPTGDRWGFTGRPANVDEVRKLAEALTRLAVRLK